LPLQNVKEGEERRRKGREGKEREGRGREERGREERVGEEVEMGRKCPPSFSDASAAYGGTNSLFTVNVYQP